MTDRPITQAQLDGLEKAVDRAFAKLGLDIEFTRHFLDRVNDERNRKQITIQELGALFAKEYRRWGKQISNMPVDTEAVMKDLSSELNIPFVLAKDGNEKDLVAKTVMRKKDFKTSNKELPVENVNEKYKPGVTVLTREISFGGTDDDLSDTGMTPQQEYEAVKGIRWPYGIDVKFNDASRTVKIRTAKMKTVAKLLSKVIDFGATSAAEVLDLPPELMGENMHGATKGSQVKGTEPMPKKQKAGRGPNSPHPMRGRLVGENAEQSTNIVRDFVKQKRREGWSVYASRVDHGVEKAHRLEFEKDGVKFEVVGHGNEWELFADGPTMSGRGQEFDGLDAAFQTGTYNESAHDKNLYYVQPDGEWKKGADGRSKGRKRSELPKDAKIAENSGNSYAVTGKNSVTGMSFKLPGLSKEEANEIAKERKGNKRYANVKVIRGKAVEESAVLAAWEQYKLDERVMDPREAILRKALAYLDRKIEADKKEKMSPGGHAFDVAREINVGLNGKKLLDIWRRWKQSGEVMEAWLDDNLALINEAWDNEGK